MTRTSPHDRSELELVFSDEFNDDGVTFHPEDDLFQKAVDPHHCKTGNLKRYDPTAITMKDGALNITRSKKEIQDLNYKDGIMSSWN